MSELEQVTQGRVPAKQTLEFIHRAETKFDNIETSMSDISTKFQLMQKDIQSICEKLDQNAKEHEEIMDKIDKFIESADGKYADRKIEDIFYRILWSFGFLVVGAIAAAVFKLIFK